MIEAIALTKVFKKPIEDLYNASKGGLKSIYQSWLAVDKLNEIVKGIESVGNIITIASRKPSSVSEIYFPAKIKIANSKATAFSADEIDKIFNKETRCAVITGTAGQGKSVFLRYLCVRELEINARLPLFIELRRIEEGKRLDKLIDQSLEILGLPSVLLSEARKLMFENGSIVLFLDGFDEVDRKFTLDTKDQIKRLCNSYPNIKIVISSRPGAFSGFLVDLSHSKEFEIQKLNAQDFRGFFEKIGVSNEITERLLKAIGGSSQKIKGLLSTPLMLTLLVLTCGNKQDLPATLPEFYDSLFNILASEHDETKPGYVRQKASSLSNAELELVFKAFCFASKEKYGRITLSHKDFSSALEIAMKLTGLKCTIDGFRTDITETICLMVKDGLDVTFTHKSIQEYYAASYIRSLDKDNLVERALIKISSKENILGWLNELDFLEDFGFSGYAIHVGIPHAERFLTRLAYPARNKYKVKSKNLNELLASLDMVLLINKSVERIWAVAWTAKRTSGELGRYECALFMAIRTALLAMTASARSNSRNNELIAIPLVKFMKENKSVHDMVFETAKKVAETAALTKHSLQEEHAKKEQSLFELLSG